MADKRPAFQWYPKDYLTDEHVEVMTLEQEGAYRRLMDYCWLHESIPSGLPHLAKLCRISTRRLKTIWPEIAPCFRERGDRLVHPRLDIERRKQASHKKAKSEAGKRGAEAKWGKDKNGSAIISPLAKDGFAVCSLQSASSTALTATTHTTAREVMREWLGEYGVHLDAVKNEMAIRSIKGLYLPHGTQEELWGDTPPADRPRIMATAVLRWSGEDHTNFNQRLFRRIIETVIQEGQNGGSRRSGPSAKVGQAAGGYIIPANQGAFKKYVEGDPEF